MDARETDAGTPLGLGFSGTTCSVKLLGRRD
jgi:hypothetical protein